MDRGATKKLYFRDLYGTFDLTGWTAKASFLDAPDGNVLLALTEGNGMTTDPQGITMEITDAQTAALSGGGFYAMEITNGTETYRMIEGAWLCKPGDV